MKLVFSHKPNSIYDDIKGIQYHFPHRYLANVEKAIGDLIVYYEEIPGRAGRFYSGVARVIRIRHDSRGPKLYYADLADFIDFDKLVPYRDNGGYEKRLVGADGTINGGMAINSVRPLSSDEFSKIVQDGLSTDSEWPDRTEEESEPRTIRDSSLQFGFAESRQPEIIGATFDRPVIEMLAKRKWRDAKFKQNVRTVYDRTCAFSSLRLINGKGRPEVEAAHIQPVEQGGNDWVRNGIALSGTIHWMFDRGMLSLSDNFEILVSRHLNHDVASLLNKNMQAKIPTETRVQPHRFYLDWHRRNIFKG